LLGLSSEKYIKVVCLAPELEFTNSASEGVARILRLVGREVSGVSVQTATEDNTAKTQEGVLSASLIWNQNIQLSPLRD
jgi:hypothetical protein